LKNISGLTFEVLALLDPHSGVFRDKDLVSKAVEKNKRKKRRTSSVDRVDYCFYKGIKNENYCIPSPCYTKSTFNSS